MSVGCSNAKKQGVEIKPTQKEVVTKVFPGDYNTAKYVPLLKGKNVALVVNQSAKLGNTHLLDTLIALEVNVKKIFVPEHGFRGSADAGASISNDVDKKTGIPIISLYGKKKKPTSQDFEGIDVLVFDIQDVGVRFYTYISTLFYVMQTAAENDKNVIVLDRPNPNGHYVDGPVLDEKFKSFVGILPIPVVYGMTIGELALMINGENWLGKNLKCNLTVVPNTNYTHLTHYKLPIAPSPNLPNSKSITLYPSLCFFEGTCISVGRGTALPFQQIGHPDLKQYFDYSFVPKSGKGSSNPKLKDKHCYGIGFEDLVEVNFRHNAKLELKWIIDFYNKFKDKKSFFLKNNFIDKLAGNDKLRTMIIAGKDERYIRESWAKDLEKFKANRKKYLLYPDFY